jgi:LCP family protein required for cell wall assembly
MVGVVAALVISAGTVVYLRLNANLRSAALFTGANGDPGKEKADPFGRIPLNILAIGSDTRASAVDCRIGGGCGGGANADVQMIVHVAADRTNATVMSIPRDTMTDLPACIGTSGARTAAHRGQINSTLAYGPGCTVAAVHQLTGIPIDHFVMVDFAGVIAMSDAVGGANVCVTDNVYDTYAQLKLAKGAHTLKGTAALAFLRSRHGFGDGSDLGRTYAQHLFLSAVIRNLKSARTLTNPGALYSLADAATRALTVDPGLASIPSLLALAAQIDKVPTGRITFSTMPNGPDPSNAARVVPAPAARTLFTAIAKDRSLSTPPPAAASAGQSKAPSGAPSTPPKGTSPSAAPRQAPSTSASKARIAVKVENGSGLTGRASTIAKALVAQGFSGNTTFTASPGSAPTTLLRYGPRQQAAARAVAEALNLPDSALKPVRPEGLVLVVGRDWPAGDTFPGPTATSPAATPAPVPANALDQAHVQTADQSGTCAQVSSFPTSLLDGGAVTPARAYALSPGVKDSAP